MRKIIIVFFSFLLFSCAPQRITLSPFITAYKSDWIGNIYPEYILLRTQPKVFEIYTPGSYESVFGEWNICNDTLCLFPRHEYYSRNSELKISEITPSDTSVTTITHRYLIKKDCLIDITDYDIVLHYNSGLQELFSNPDYKAVYKKITSHSFIREQQGRYTITGRSSRE
jgi:hypothetical protein